MPPTNAQHRDVCIVDGMLLVFDGYQSEPQKISSITLISERGVMSSWFITIKLSTPTLSLNTKGDIYEKIAKIYINVFAAALWWFSWTSIFSLSGPLNLGSWRWLCNRFVVVIPEIIWNTHIITISVFQVYLENMEDLFLLVVIRFPSVGTETSRCQKKQRGRQEFEKNGPTRLEKEQKLGISTGESGIYPLVNIQKTIENGNL